MIGIYLKSAIIIAILYSKKNEMCFNSLDSKLLNIAQSPFYNQIESNLIHIFFLPEMDFTLRQLFNIGT